MLIPPNRVLVLTETGGSPGTEALEYPDGAPPLPAPSWTAAPAISGTAQVGQTLSVSNGTVSNGSVTAHQWRRGSSAISGATGATYQLVTADLDALITCRLTADGPGGSSQATTAAVGPVAAAGPAIPAGHGAVTLRVGGVEQPLTLNVGGTEQPLYLGVPA